jgi:uncharacterized protein YkwD
LAVAADVSAQIDPGLLLNSHNAYRARHCAPPISWSLELAAGAQRWANRCVFNHDRNNEFGENLAWGTRLSAQEAVALWYEEAPQYNFAAPGFGPAGHFSQLIWRGSRLLGCGGAKCGNDVFWVCRYAPPGNVEGQYRANVAPTCR